MWRERRILMLMIAGRMDLELRLVLNCEDCDHGGVVG